MDDAIAATIKLCKLQRRNQNPFFIQPCGNEFTTEIAAEIKNIFRIHDYLRTRLPPENWTVGLQVSMTTKQEKIGVGIIYNLESMTVDMENLK
jgi:hypothetical protein